MITELFTIKKVQNDTEQWLTDEGRFTNKGNLCTGDLRCFIARHQAEGYIDRLVHAVAKYCVIEKFSLVEEEKS